MKKIIHPKDPQFSISNHFRTTKVIKNNQEQTFLPNLPEDKRKKWMQALEQTKQEVQIMRVIHCTNSSQINLAKMGSSFFFTHLPKSKSISKLHNQSQNAANSSQIKNFSVKKKQNSQALLKKIRKSMNPQKEAPTSSLPKNQKFNIINFQSKNKEIYTEEERPVFRIGLNMQNDAKLKQSHIMKIFKMKLSSQDIIPTVYSIKEENEDFVPSPLQPKQNNLAVCICLFAESLDPKVQRSNEKRQKYLMKMKKHMHETYDPEILSKMKIYGKRPQFIAKNYQKALSKFTQKLDAHTLDKISKIVNSNLLKLSENSNTYSQSLSEAQSLESQIITFYQIGNSIAKLDYFIKNKENKQTIQNVYGFPIEQYLIHKAYYIASQRIKYHGGYSKRHYNQWHKFYTENKCSIEKKLKCFCEKNQLTNSWLQNFTNINLIETQYFQVRRKTVNLSQFVRIQECRVDLIIKFIRSAWSSGIYSILLQKYTNKFNRKIRNAVFENPQKMYYWNRELEALPQKQELSEYKKIILNKTSFKELIFCFKKSSKQKNSELKLISGFQTSYTNIELLLNIYYEQLITRSLYSYIYLITNSNKALFSLQLVVDRQTLKFKESQDKVISDLISIIEKMLNFHFQLNSTHSDTPQQKLEQNQQDSKSDNQSSRLASDGSIQQPKKLPIFSVRYKYKEIHAKTINNFTNSIRANYRQAQQIVQNFSEFMPFIKLTAKEKLFVQESSCKGRNQWEIAQEMFTKNLNSVDFYREQLDKIPNIISRGVFQINCEEPLKLLTDRLNQLQYISQQKYLNKVYQKIHEHEQEIARIMTISHCNTITAENMDEVLYKFDVFIHDLSQIKISMKDLAHRIFFYAIRKPKSNTLVARYEQLIAKRKQLVLKIKKLKQTAIYDCIILQKQFGQLKIKTVAQIKQFQERISSAMQQYFDLSKIENYVKKLQTIKEEFLDFRDKITPELFKTLDKQKIQIIQRKSQILFSHWSHISNFYAHSKILHLKSLNEIDIHEYTQFIQNCEKNRAQFLATFNPTDFDELKWLLNKFDRDLDKYKNLIPYLRLLGTIDIPLEYFEEFGCLQFRRINFKKLLLVDKIDQYYVHIEEMATKADCQNHIYEEYKEIEELMKSLKIKIVDNNGNDSIDKLCTKQIIEQMSNCIYRCSNLLSKRYCEKYEKIIQKLKFRISKCSQIMNSWLGIQKQYFSLEEFYRNNDDAERQEQFKQISSLYKKIIKSFDIDDSIWFVPKNQYFIKSKDSICQSVIKLKADLFDYFSEIKSSNPRLYMLSHEELLTVMSNIEYVPRYLSKCLPSVGSVTIKEDSIQRFGGVAVKLLISQKDKKNDHHVTGNYVMFQEPLQIGARLSQISSWLQKIRVMIQNKLRNDYLHFHLTKNPCLQIILLKIEISFTSQIEQILNSDQKKEHLLNIEKNIQRKIEKCRKQINERFQFQNQMKIMQYLIHRDIAKSLIETENQGQSSDCYQWLKVPKYYENHESQNQSQKKKDADIVVKIMSRCYEYGFMFVQNCEMTCFSGASIYGNYLVGVQFSGKLLAIKSLAYLTGHELFIHQPMKTSPKEIENIIYFFKINVFCGSWLAFPDLHLLSQTAICIIGECLRKVAYLVDEASSYITFFNCRPLKINPNFDFFFFSHSYDNRLDERIKNYLRPQQIVKPNGEFLYNLHLQTFSQDNYIETTKQLARIDYQTEKIFKIIEFYYWCDNFSDIPLEFFVHLREYLQGKVSKDKVNVFNNKLMDGLLAIKFIIYGGECQNIEQYLKGVNYLACYLNTLKQQKVFQSLISDTNVLYIRKPLKSWKSLIQFLQRTSHKKYIVIKNGLIHHKEISQLLQQYEHPKIIYLQKWSQIHNESILRYSHNIPTFSMKNCLLKKIQQCSQSSILARRKRSTKFSAKDKNQKKTKKITFKEEQLKADKYKSEKIQLSDQRKEKIREFGWSKNVLNLYEDLRKFVLKQLGTDQKQITQIYENLSDLASAFISQGYEEENIFVYLAVWFFGNLFDEKILKDWLQIHKKIQDYPNLPLRASLSPQPVKKDKYYQRSSPSLIANLANLFKHCCQKSIIISNTQNIKQIFSTPIQSPQTCLHIYPEEMSTLSDLKKITDFIKYNSVSQKNRKRQSSFSTQSNQEPLKKERVQILIHSMEHILKHNKQLGNLLLELGNHKNALIEVNGDLEMISVQKCHIVIEFANPIEQLYREKISGFYVIEIKNEDIHQIQKQKLLQFYQAESQSVREIVLLDHFKLYQKILGKLAKYELIWMLNFQALSVIKKIEQKNMCHVSIRKQLIESFKHLYIFLSITFTQQIMNPSEFLTLIEDVFVDGHYPCQEFLKDLQKTLIQYELCKRKALCRGLMEICSSFTLHHYLFRLLQIMTSAIEIGHSIVFSPLQAQFPYCIDMVSSFLSVKTICYEDYCQEIINTKQNDGDRKILIITENEFTQEILEHLQRQITKNQQKFNKRYTIVISLNKDCSSYKKSFNNYPFLQLHFFHIFYPQITAPQLHKIIDLQQTLKMLEQNHDEIVFCRVKKWDKPIQLYEGKSIVSFFQKNLQKNDCFAMEFFQNRKQVEELEFNKYKFYKSLTELMFDNISELTVKLEKIPCLRKELFEEIQELEIRIEEKFRQIQAKNSEAKELSNGMTLLVNMLQTKIQALQDRQVSINRHKKQFTPLFQKLYDRIEALPGSELSKLKNKYDSELITTIKHFINSLLVSKNKILPLKMLRIIMKQNQSALNKHMDLIRKLAQQIKTQNKAKIDKYGIVFRVLADWIVLCDSMQAKVLQQIKKIEDAREKQRSSMQHLQQQIQQEKGQIQKRENLLLQTKQELRILQIRKSMLEDQIKQLEVSEQRIVNVLKIINEKEYKKKISKDLAEWLFHAAKIIMRKIIKRMTMNQFDLQPHFIENLFFRVLRLDTNFNTNSIYEHEYWPSFSQYGLTENNIDHNIFGDYDISSSEFDEICQNSSGNLIDKSEEKMEQFCFERSELLKQILSCPKQIQILEDSQFYMKELLVHKFSLSENSIIIQQEAENFTWLKSTIKSKINSYRWILVIGPGFLSQEDTIQFYFMIDNLLKKRKSGSAKLVFLFRSIDTEYKFSSFRYTSGKKIDISYYNWVRIFGRQTINPSFFSIEGPYRKSLAKLNSSLKHLFQRIEHFKPESAESYQKLTHLFTTIENNQENYQKNKIIYEQQIKEFMSVGNLSTPYYILYKVCQELQKNYPIALFQSGRCLQNFIRCLKRSKLSFADREPAKFQENFRKFSVNLSYEINFISQVHLYYFMMIVSFLLLKPKDTEVIGFLSLQHKIKKIKSPSEKLFQILRILEKREFDSNQLEQVLKNNYYSIKQSTTYLIFAFINPEKHSPCFLNTIKQSKQCSIFYEEIMFKNKSLYYQQLFHQIRSNFVNYKRMFKKIWVIKSEDKEYNSCVGYLRERIKKEFKGEAKIFPMYYDSTDMQTFMSKLRSSASCSIHLNLINIKKEQFGRVLDMIIKEITEIKQIHSNFRIYVITNNPQPVRLKQYLEYFEYQGLKEEKEAIKEGEGLGILEQRLCNQQQILKQFSQEEFVETLNQLSKSCENKLIPMNLFQVLKDQLETSRSLTKNNFIPLSLLRQLCQGDYCQIHPNSFKTITYLCIKAFLKQTHPNITKNVVKRVESLSLALCQEQVGLCLSSGQENSCWKKIMETYPEMENRHFKIMIIENNVGSQLMVVGDLQALAVHYHFFIKLVPAQQQYILPIYLKLTKKHQPYT